MLQQNISAPESVASCVLDVALALRLSRAVGRWFSSWACGSRGEVNHRPRLTRMPVCLAVKIPARFASAFIPPLSLVVLLLDVESMGNLQHRLKMLCKSLKIIFSPLRCELCIHVSNHIYIEYR
ncbi:hypothetical protein GOODEAATRI_027907 [Goodea atripinnis]|uniref:Uncharacterized protein n=1 Tax=Goodea atripinnis TaxID=208336 RepID=A0ABV0PHM4_9TELE